MGRDTLLRERSVSHGYQDFHIKNDWTAYLEGTPFSKPVNSRLSEIDLRFLTVTVDYYERWNSRTVENWGGFAGIVPVNSMPGWLVIPQGDNRWRLVDESLEECMDTDGRRKLVKRHRALLGIPPAAVDWQGDRLEWNQAVFGQKDWGDL